MGKPVGPRFRQMVRKIPGTGKFPSGNRVYHLYELVPFTGKWPRSPETGVKDGFEEMGLEFLFGIFRPEKQDNLFRCSVAPGNFPLERPKSHVPFTFQPDFPESFCKQLEFSIFLVHS